MRFLLGMLVFALAAGAQTPEFEVASIRPNKAMGERSSIRLSNGLVTMENVSLTKIILNAYGIPDDRRYMLDGPGWLGTESFDVQARFPANTPTPQVRQMLQALLAQRFGLALHRETRQLPIYSLVVAKSGPKIHAVVAGQAGTSAGPGRLEATKITMQKLADLLARFAGTPVTNATGLDGVYDFVLEWSPDETLKMPAADGTPAPGNGGPSIFTALEEQLGLKLAGGKGPVEILVVDHVEKVPTGN